MKSIDPQAASASIEDGYRRYLLSLMPLQDPNLVEAIAQKLSRARTIATGPYLEMTPPFETAASLSDLVDEGVLNPGMRSVFSETLPGYRALYRHQEDAIRKAVSGRNLMIATGTGSGKTESFIVPILNELVAEREAGTLGPGVRALLLYPMNALANDQLKRLRDVLQGVPDITFGRYTGDTRAGHSNAVDAYREQYGEEPLPNELVSREQIQANPPHFLITNYAMLEYLLLRPEDMTLFDEKSSDTWRFVVVDEAHVYDGIKGAEIALLLRRLRDRIGAGANLQYLASSATVGNVPHKVSEFGTRLFNANFEWDPHDEDKQDVITATRRAISEGDVWGQLSPSVIKSLSQEDAPETWLNEHGYGGIEDEKSMRRLQNRLSRGPASLAELGGHLFPEVPVSEQQSAVVNLVSLGHRIRDQFGSPVLSARYHLFVTALEGAFVCLAKETPHVEFSPHASCPQCSNAMYELAGCKRCGQIHLLGHVLRENDFEVLATRREPNEPPHWVVLGSDTAPFDEDDEAHLVGHRVASATTVSMCVGCGAFQEHGARSCRRCGSDAMHAAQRVDSRSSGLDSCLSCGGRSSGQIRRFSSGANATSAVIATSLYPFLPTDSQVTSASEGRRLLMFSDSRQQAAFAAPYLEQTYEGLMHRSILLAGLASAGADLSTDDLKAVTVEQAETRRIFVNERATAHEKSRTVGLWVQREIIQGAERNSLEGTALASVRLFRPTLPAPQPLINLGLEEENVWDFLDELFQTLRFQGAVEPSTQGVDLAHEYLAPRNRKVAARLRESDAKLGVISWLPTGRAKTNGRVDFVSRILRRLGSTIDPEGLLEQIWRFIIGKNDVVRWVNSHTDRKAGTVYLLDPQALRWSFVSEGESIWRCDLCRRMTPRSILGVCPTNSCGGTLVRTRVSRENPGHYESLYLSKNNIPLRAEEHTAQLANEDASKVQEDFVKGTVNVLSCSTTFEMGVDVGELESVFLRNVPPTTANYVQRAGRAGRRTESSALVVTYAQMRSHDQGMYRQPTAMIRGKMRAPVIVSDNSRVGRRHAHSVVLSAFFREQFIEHKKVFRTVNDFYGENGGQQAFEAYLDSLPAAVSKSVETILPRKVLTEIGFYDGSWLAKLQQLVDGAGDQYRDESSHFDEQLKEAVSKSKFSLAAMISRSLKTVDERRLIDYFSRVNVLPKYGFPVDTVELRVDPAAEARAASLDLSRDLTMAVNEYAPGNSIVARGLRIESAGVRTVPKKDLIEQYYAICHECDAIEVSLKRIDDICSCGAHRRGATTKFVKPEFGFLASRTVKSVGLVRPVTRWNGRQFLLRRGKQTDEGIVGTALGVVSWNLYIRGQMLVLNEGPGRSRFFICNWCGYGLPGTEKFPATHENPLNGNRCGGNYSSLALGHDFETDVLILELPGIGDLSVARSVLYGLLAGASDALELARDDLDGTIIASEKNAIVLFDAVPGGAGLVKRIAEELPQVIEAMRDRVEACDCGKETSCYRCLRVYRNQVYHNELTRNAILNLLGAPPSPGAVDPNESEISEDQNTLISPTERVLLAQIKELGLPNPIVGYETAGGIPLSISWPKLKVALAEGLDIADTIDLAAEGWTIHSDPLDSLHFAD